MLYLQLIGINMKHLKRSLTVKISATLCHNIKSISVALSMTALCFVSGCALSPKAQPEAIYQCERGTILSVVFKEMPISKIRGGRNAGHSTTYRVQSAFITLNDGQTLELPAQAVASGFMMSNGRYTLRGKGDEARWSVGRMAEESCEKIS